MGMDVEHVSTRNIKTSVAAVHARQIPNVAVDGTRRSDLPAVHAQQEATSGAGGALLAVSANPSAPAGTVQGPGELLRLQDAQGRTAFTVGQDGSFTNREQWSHTDLGFTAWNFPCYVCSASSSAPTAGRLYGIRIPLPPAGLPGITKLYLGVGTQGSTLTAGQNFAMLYNSTGARLATSGDMTTSWQAAGLSTATFTATDLSGPYVNACWYQNGTTPARFVIGAFGMANGALAAANSLFFQTSDTGLTTTPPSTLGTITAAPYSVWGGLG